MATGYNAETGQSDLKASEDLEELTCQPCHKKGRLKTAVGMCTDCLECLCQSCYDIHTIPTPLQNHELLGKEQMLKSQGSFKRKDKCNEKCDIHDDDIIKYYCIDHCSLGCGVCITLNHRSCDKVCYIPHVAKDLANNDEYKQAEAQLKFVFAQSKRVNKTTKDHIKAIQDDCLDAIEIIQEFRREINVALDRTENGLIEKVKSLETEEIKKVEDIADTYKNARTHLQSTMEMLEKFQRNEQNCSMYTFMMKIKNRLAYLENKIQTAEKEQSRLATKIKFVPDREILSTIWNPNALGSVCFYKTQAEESETDTMSLRQIEHIGNGNVKSQADINDCWITGSVSLPDNRILLTDTKNKALKITDVHGAISMSLSLSDAPWDVTIISNNQVAVTLPLEESIAIVSVTASTMSLDRKLSVSGGCYGISYRDDKLAVTLYDKNKVKVLDLQGSVLHTIAADKKELAIVSEPLYVTFGRDSTTLYVSCERLNNVVCVKCDGTVEAIYTDTKLKGPRGVAVGMMGNVYVCAKDSNQILQITPGDAKIKTISTGTVGLIEPYSIHYNERNHTFCVGVWNNRHTDNDSNTIKMYKAMFSLD